MIATSDVLAGTPFSINTLPIKASPTPKPAPAPTTAPDLEAQELEAYKQKGQLAELKDEAVLKKEKETAEAQAKTTADYAKAVTEDPTRKLLGEKVKERADTTFVPTKETAADMGLLFTLTNIVGFMIGGKSKGNAQQAMSAMNGMLEGHQKGREDLYKKEKAIFEENTKALDKTIEALDRQFKEAMQIYAVDKEAGMAKAQSAIAEHNATFLGDALKKNGLAYSADLLAKAVAQKDKKELAMQKLKQREEDIKRQERQHRENIALREREVALREKTAEGKLLKSTDDVQTYLQARGINIASAKDRAEVAKVVSSMAELNSLRNDVINNPNLIGRQGQIQQFTDRYIKSLKGESPPLDESKIDQADQEALLFSKKYASMLTRYEQALAGGSRGFTVAFQKRFNDLLSQNQFNAPSITRLFDDMSHEIAAGATQKSPQKLTYGVLEDMASNFQNALEEPGATTALAQPSEKPIPTEADRERGRSSESSRQNFIRHFGVEP